jgi:hypothetical protein
MEKKMNTELEKNIVNTLDKSLAEIDDMTVQRLKNTRAIALAKKNLPKWIHLAVAASFMLLIAIPVIWKKNHFDASRNTPTEFISQELPPAAQELDDIDMLMAIDIETRIETHLKPKRAIL